VKRHGCAADRGKSMLLWGYCGVRRVGRHELGMRFDSNELRRCVFVFAEFAEGWMDLEEVYIRERRRGGVSLLMDSVVVKPLPAFCGPRKKNRANWSNITEYYENRT
jgi:hypothetical protein